MPKSITELSVFISCPSGMNEVRGVALAAIEEVGATLRVTNCVSLRPISWTQDIMPGVGEDGQEVINSQTLNRYDIYLGMLGSRFGTPTRRAGSGTEEEFDLALEQFRQDPSSIRILFYLQAFGANPYDLDVAELTKVQAFKVKLQQRGVLYRELRGLDDALASIKAHLLSLISEQWDQQSGQWHNLSTKRPQEAGEIFLSSPVIESVPPPSDSLDNELGLLELQMAGVQELHLATVSITKLGANLNRLTEKTESRFAALEDWPAPNQIMDLYAVDMEEFVANSAGEAASSNFHLSKGASHFEVFHNQARTLELDFSASANSVLQALETVEPSMKQFRESILGTKQVLAKLPPMTRKLRLAKKSLTAFFDDVALEMTLSIERLSLLKTRLSDLPSRPPELDC